MCSFNLFEGYRFLKCLTLRHLYLFQLDNADEQAAQVRRELDGRLQLVETMARVSPNCLFHALHYIFMLMSAIGLLL